MQFFVAKSTMKNLLILISLAFPCSLALQDDTFINGFYYRDTINTIKDPEKVPNL